MNFISIQEVANYIGTNQTEIKIRRGRKSDCREVHKLIRELAEYGKMSVGPRSSYKVLEEDGFNKNPPLFHLFVAEKPEKESKGDCDKLIAYAMYYNKYSSWLGKAMYLEDLYCVPEYRKKNVGSALFRAVVKEAVNTGCNQLDFEVLEWNPARKFYEKLGAIDITEKETWHFYRMTLEAMKALEAGCKN